MHGNRGSGKTTHAELIWSVLQYVVETLECGDLQAIEDAGFSPKQIERIRRLELPDLRHLSRTRAHFLQLQVDSERLNKLLDYIERERQRKAIRDELLRLGASHPMMHGLYGMSTREYASARRMLGIAGDLGGRPRAATPEEERLVWESWAASSGTCEEAERFLALARDTRVPLPTLWSLIRTWTAEQTLSPLRAPQRDPLSQAQLG